MHQLIQCWARERELPISQSDALDGSSRRHCCLNNLHKLGMKTFETLKHQSEQYFILICKIFVDERRTVLNCSGNRTDCPVLSKSDPNYWEGAWSTGSCHHR